ncbi:fasciclin-like arabinogalactan protein 21 [Fagus crenata]
MANVICKTLDATMLLLVAFFAISPTIEALCSDAMATTLSSSGFSLFAHALHAHNVTTTTTTNSTPLMYLAPPETTLLNHNLDDDTIRGHVSTAGALSYQSLLTLPANTTLPTLHNNTTLIVGTDGIRVSFNNVLVAVPNLYIDGSCAIHGVDGPLVPAPSSVDDVLPSPAHIPRRHFHQISDYVRFIRRASHQSLVNGTKKPGLH